MSGEPAVRSAEPVWSGRVGPALLVAAVLLVAGCGDAAGPSGSSSPEPEERVRSLEFVAGGDQEILSGRRSPDPFRVRATDAAGSPVADAEVRFSVEGEGGGILSQPTALTDSTGTAETYLLESRSGDAVLSARSGPAEADLGFHVTRAPNELRFEPASGAVGLPGQQHPDSVVRVRVLDARGRPMEGEQVFFVGPLELSTVADTSDAEGWTQTIIRRSRLSAGPGFVTAFMITVSGVSARTRRPVEAPARRVFLVSVDGLRGDALDRWNPPVLERLKREGAFTTNGRTVLPSLTVPAHLSMLSGVSPEGHGVFGDELSFTAEMANLEPLFRHASRQGLNARAYMARDGPLESFEIALNCKLAFGLDSLTLVEPGGNRITTEADEALSDPEVELVFVHLPDPDVAGHAHGWTSPEYGRAVLRADSAVGRIVDRAGEETLVIVTSDHGGGGDFGSHLHGSDAPEDVRIPLLMWGSRVRVIKFDEASILDVASTALWALGFEPPDHYEGRPLLEFFR